MEITFPLLSALDFDHGAVAFPADFGGTRHRCLVTEEALQDHFDGAGAELVEVFEANRARIELVAREKIGAGATGVIMIKSSDF